MSSNYTINLKKKQQISKLNKNPTTCHFVLIEDIFWHIYIYLCLYVQIHFGFDLFIN